MEINYFVGKEERQRLQGGMCVVAETHRRKPKQPTQVLKLIALRILLSYLLF